MPSFTCSDLFKVTFFNNTSTVQRWWKTHHNFQKWFCSIAGKFFLRTFSFGNICYLELLSCSKEYGSLMTSRQKMVIFIHSLLDWSILYFIHHIRTNDAASRHFIMTVFLFGFEALKRILCGRGTNCASKLNLNSASYSFKHDSWAHSHKKNDEEYHQYMTKNELKVVQKGSLCGSYSTFNWHFVVLPAKKRLNASISNSAKWKEN